MGNRTLKIADIKEGEKLTTAGGFDVISWHRVQSPNTTFFPIRAMIKCEDGEIRELPYTHNGRRYINIKSKYDLVIPSAIKKVKKERPYNPKLNAMPDPIMGIHFIKTKQYERISAINRNGTPTNSVNYVTPSVEVML